MPNLEQFIEHEWLLLRGARERDDTVGEMQAEVRLNQLLERVPRPARF